MGMRLDYFCTHNQFGYCFCGYICCMFNFLFCKLLAIYFVFVTSVPDLPSEGSVRVWFWSYLLAFCSPLLHSRASLIVCCLFITPYAVPSWSLNCPSRRPVQRCHEWLAQWQSVAAVFQTVRISVVVWLSQNFYLYNENRNGRGSRTQGNTSCYNGIYLARANKRVIEQVK